LACVSKRCISVQVVRLEVLEENALEKVLPESEATLITRARSVISISKEPSRAVSKHACARWLCSRAVHKHQSAEENSQVYYYDCTTACVEKRKCCCSEALRRRTLCTSMPRRQHTLLVYCRCFLTACATDEKWSIINTKSGQINYSMRPLGLSFVFVFLCFSGEARLIQLIYFFRRANSTCINIELSELTQLRPLSSSATQLRWCNSNSDLTPTQLRPKRCRPKGG
jgi:hypothetical protein